MSRILIVFLSICFFTATSYSQKNSEQLSEVTVIASRTIQKADGYVVNLRGSDITKGKPAIDALQLLPSISYESKSLKINGLGVSEIYLDGLKLNDYSELDNIPADMIDKVEVRYFSGANQNTSQAGGSIWITLRRPPEGGFTGSLGGNAKAIRRNGVSHESLYGVINGRYGKVSFYDYTSASWMQYKEWQTQTISSPSETTHMNTMVNTHNGAPSNRLSLTYDFNKRTYLAASYYVASQSRRQNSLTKAEWTNETVDQRNSVTANGGTLKLNSQLNEKGLTLTVIGDYLSYINRSNQLFHTSSSESSPFHYKNSTEMWEAYAYVDVPINQTMAFNGGVSAKIISIHYRPDKYLNSDRFDSSGISTNTSGLTPMAFASLRGAFGQLRYSAGLNWMLNKIEYEPLDGSERTKNTQWAINPTVQVMYPFGAGNKHSFSISYKHILDKIPYSAISSLVRWEDAYNYSVGNPDLKATTEHFVMAGVNLFNNLLNLNASYFYDNNAITWETFADANNENVFYTKPVNYDGEQSWALRAELNVKPLKPWRLKFITRFSLNPEDVTIGNVHYDKTRFRHIYILNNSFSFKNGWNAMINADIEPTFHSLDRTYHTVYKVQGNISKLLLNNNLEVGVNFTPVSKRRKLDRRTNGTTVTLHYTNPEYAVGLNLRWFFRGGKQVKTNIAVGTQDYEETVDTK